MVQPKANKARRSILWPDFTVLSSYSNIMVYRNVDSLDIYKSDSPSLKILL